MDYLYTFSKPLTKSNDDFIKLNFLLASRESMQTIDFINSYRISNFWKGKFFIKKLIKRVFKYRLKQKIIWDRKFWEIINIYYLNYTYTLPNNINNLDDLILVLSKDNTKKRFNDIIKYKKLIKKGINLNYPLFISGKALNILGANVNNNNIYFLDGTRRLLANILCSNKNNKILIIDI